MTYEQMMQACSALGPISICMRKSGDWYVHHVGVSLKNKGLIFSLSGNGSSPVDAIHDHWRQLTEFKPQEYLVLNAMDANNIHAVRWNGFMWQEVEMKK